MTTAEIVLSVAIVGLLITMGGIVFGAGKMRREVDDLTQWKKDLPAQLAASTAALSANTARAQSLETLLDRVSDQLGGMATKAELETHEVRFSGRIDELQKRIDEVLKEQHELARQISRLREQFAHAQGEQGKKFDRAGSSPDHRG